VKGRATRQRAAVAAAHDEVDEFRSAQELHDMLKHKGDSVGLTTVYRSCSTGEHHHLVCRVCARPSRSRARRWRSGRRPSRRSTAL
jgi:Fur family transcriptional regulator, ferric uptake regulator